MHPDLPAFHTSTFSDWTKNSFVIESNPQVYHHSAGGYPITATASTPSYCSNFSEASHSSPTLFWAAPTPTTAATVEENALFTTGEIASAEINPVKSAEIPTSEVIFENTSEIRNLETQNKSNQYIYHPHQSVSQNSSKKASEDFYNNKATPTAVMKKEDQRPITYLNRGQTYLLELSSTSQQRGTLTSTISIAFHESGHRKIAASYWRFWLSQQLNPEEARAVSLDENQTTGIYNINYVSFDKVTFDWHGRFGAKIYVRFHCLSTDFSRIKGVKGIPLRAVVETTAKYNQLPDNPSSFSGTFSKKDNSTNPYLHLEDQYEYVERCYCQIKLFRDKGAERKNKDDSKQINKQMEKAIALTLGHPEQHPLWPIINQPYKPVTILSETPSSPDINLHDDFQSDIIATPSTPSTTTTLYSPTVMEKTCSKTKNEEIFNHNKKRKQQQSCRFDKSTGVIPPSQSQLKKLRTTRGVLNFFVKSKRQFPPISTERVSLEYLTREDLKTKLSTILSLHPSRISEILWKKKRSSTLESKKSADDMLVLVEDPFIAEHILDEETILVDWEIKPDGYVRLILEFDDQIK
ncbi:hypothetical protein G6F46_004517 [Rhizopus delemar]|nr:hypothetical protein G6F55_002863 [Rhizopus delemar]KAG1523611.1 hypothetical protein G6F52_004883 [Rhizopus delemar]KAG1617651.1 hypothetical protein G6F46_004517 [Rhizopus delemar]KAG1636517.1 hypothetical protein G6F44_009523 [Rhizopus delemar]